MGFIFDSNIFDKFVDDRIKLEEIKKEENKYFVTHVQFDQLSKTTDRNRRQLLLSMFSKISSKNLPTESTIFGVSKSGMAKLSDGNFIEKLRKGNIKHTSDALIGEVAIKNNLILVTEDNRFRKRIKSAGGRAITFDEFKKIIKE